MKKRSSAVRSTLMFFSVQVRRRLSAQNQARGRRGREQPVVLVAGLPAGGRGATAAVLADAVHAHDAAARLDAAQIPHLQVQRRVSDTGLERARHAEAHGGVEHRRDHPAVHAAHRVGVELLRLHAHLHPALPGLGHPEAEGARRRMVRDGAVDQSAQEVEAVHVAVRGGRRGGVVPRVGALAFGHLPTVSRGDKPVRACHAGAMRHRC
ncbi:exported hypothetical protein [Rhodococcus ruber]|uniref:Uncharacterized protein n=1 Tax=Rhodococcus ruber TaxID=1830 RepID=A0A098BJC8_9NOCA|nr:exported hypothetical protein [Rhodococcus ruber]